MRVISAADVIVLDDSSEDDGQGTTAPPARRALIGAMDSSTRKVSSLDEDEDDGFEILTPLPAPGRSLEESLSFSELQAQQIAFAQLHRQANRRKARASEAPSSRPKAPAKGKAAARGGQAPRARSPSTGPSLSSSPSTDSSPRSDSKVLKKTALTPTFSAKPRHNDTDKADKAKTTRERRAPPSFSDLQAQDQVYSRLKSQWKKTHNRVEDSSSSAGDSSDTEILDDDDDDFVSGPERTTEDTSDDDDFVVPESKKPKVHRSANGAAKSAAPSGARNPFAKKAAKPKTKKRYTKKSLGKANSSAGGAPAAVVELVTDTLANPRDATNSVVHCSSWRGVYFDAAPVCVLPMDKDIGPEFEFEFERPLAAYDATGKLEVKAKLLSSFGQAKQLVVEDGNEEPEQTKTQEQLVQQVSETVDRELSQLKGLYAEKARAIMAEARKKTAAYLESLAAHKDQRLSVLPKQLAVDAVEQKLIAELKHPVRLRPSQTVRMKFIAGDDESETKVRPQDVYKLPKLRPLSKATAYVGVKANVRVEDDPIMHYVPYFGDHDDGEVIDVNNYEGIKARNGIQRSGLDGEVDEYLLRVIVRRFGDSDKVFSALKTAVGFAQGYSDYCEIKKTLEARRLATSRIGEAKQILGGGASKLPALTPLLRDAITTHSTLSDRFAPPTTYFEANSARNFNDREHGLGLRATSDYRELCVTYRDLFCRMCYCYDCPEHGIQHPAPSHRVDPVNPEVRLAPVVLAKSEQGNASTHSQVDESPCTISESPPENEVNQGTEDVQSDGNSAKEDQPMTAEEIEAVVEASSVEDRRRSSRSHTRISSLASASLKLQSVRAETVKPVRAPKPKPVKKMADESEYLDDSHYKMVSSMVKDSIVSDACCSDACWKRPLTSDSSVSEAKDSSSAPSGFTSASFTPTELLLIDKLRYIIGDNACLIASIIKSTPCRDIYAFLASETRGKPARSESMDAATTSPVAQSTSGRKRGRGAGSQGSNNRVPQKRTRYQRMKDIGANHEYEPCNHEGTCDSKVCSCMTRDHTCDKACSCSRDCSNRFQGCRCSYGNCRTKACPCFVAMRECVPDMCVTCGASEAPVVVFSDELKGKSALELGICCNVNILRGLHKKLGVAFSTTHGWGAFAREPIKRGEFIYEYHGALLSQDEAERRGNIYDKMAISFLFDANEDSVVDAVRKGNKSKFANHSSVGQKCLARVMRVGGEHRISIWAKQDIEKGEELFFDYGYHGKSAPDWSQLRIKGASARHAKDDNSDDD